jgi:hypothetical protein
MVVVGLFIIDAEDCCRVFLPSSKKIYIQNNHSVEKNFYSTYPARTCFTIFGGFPGGYGIVVTKVW